MLGSGRKLGDLDGILQVWVYYISLNWLSCISSSIPVFCSFACSDKFYIALHLLCSLLDHRVVFLVVYFSIIAMV